MSKKTNERSRTWVLVLYPQENDSHRLILDTIQRNISQSWQWVSINHQGEDKEDSDERGKDHTHILVRFENAVYRNSLLHAFNINLDNQHFLRSCKSYKGYLLYMIHHGYFEKIQYDIDDMEGCVEIKTDLKHFRDKTEREDMKVKKLLTWIESQGIISTTDLVHYALDENLWSEYRRAQHTFKDLIREHNERVSINHHKRKDSRT